MTVPAGGTSRAPAKIIAFPAARQDQETDLGPAWERARAAWLTASAARSVHTARSYARAIDDFAGYVRDYFSIPLWLVETAHARAWQEHLTSEGKSQATVAQRMAAGSSFYEFVVAERHLINGVESSIFCDRRGRPRSNPFRGNVERPRHRRYGDSRPLAPEVVEKTMRHIDVETLTGARDYALLLTFLYTGWRSGEVLGMRWGDIQPHPGGPGWICRWRGKGGKEEDVALPAKCEAAIRRYLEQADRPLSGLAPTDYIWQPLSVHGCRNFAHVGPLTESGRHITPMQANNILRKRLRLAGVAGWQDYHVHSLRHTFAHAYVESRGGDVLGLSKHLHHASLAITQVYLASLRPPVDDYSAGLEEVYGI